MQEQVRSIHASATRPDFTQMPVPPQVQVLGVGLAVHEKLVHPEMRPLHKKLVDQFQVMRSSLCHVRESVCVAIQS